MEQSTSNHEYGPERSHRQHIQQRPHFPLVPLPTAHQRPQSCPSKYTIMQILHKHRLSMVVYDPLMNRQLRQGLNVLSSTSAISNNVSHSANWASLALSTSTNLAQSGHPLLYSTAGSWRTQSPSLEIMSLRSARRGLEGPGFYTLRGGSKEGPDLHQFREQGQWKTHWG